MTMSVPAACGRTLGPRNDWQQRKSEVMRGERHPGLRQLLDGALRAKRS